MLLSEMQEIRDKEEIVKEEQGNKKRDGESDGG